MPRIPKVMLMGFWDKTVLPLHLDKEVYKSDLLWDFVKPENHTMPLGKLEAVPPS